MKVQTANVVVGFSAEGMGKLFTEGGTFTSLIKKVQEDSDFLLFDNVSNPNFISFEHSFIDNNEIKMRLTFLDPNFEFEERFFSKLDTLGRFEDGGYQTDFFDSPSELPIDERIKKQINELTSPSKFFIAYGVGDNLDNWAGPYMVEVSNVALNVDASRKITVDFTPQPVLFRGFDTEITGRHLVVEGTSKNIFPTENITQVEESGTIPKYFPQKVLIDCLRNFTEAATGNSNVLVLLPDIPTAGIKKYSKLFNQYYKNKHTYMFINKICGALGLSLKHLNMGNQEIKDIGIYPKLLSKLDYEKSPTALAKLVKIGITAATGIAEEAEKAPKRAKIQNLNSSIPNSEIIFRVLQKVKSFVSSSGYRLSPELFIESNTKLLKFWEDEKILEKLGYEQQDPDKPVIIIGDKNLILGLLYGGNQINEAHYSQFSSKVDKNIADTLNSQYQKRVLKIYIPPTSTNSFDYSVPPEFVYQDVPENFEDLLKLNSIPIFRYNTKNSNVKKINIRDDKIYWTALTAGYNKILTEKVGALTAGVVVNSEGEPLSTAKLETIEDALIFYLIQGGHRGGFKDDDLVTKEGLEKITEVFNLDEFSSNSDKILIKEAFKAFDQADLTSSQLKDKVKQFKSTYFEAISPVSHSKNLLKFLSQQVLNVSITTIPMFNLATSFGGVSSNPGLLYAQDIPVSKNTKYSREKTRGVNQYLTGFYDILGFTNTINSSKVESRFLMYPSRKHYE
jgi:hypothetical protein